jgi:hypothetical protein
MRYRVQVLHSPCGHPHKQECGAMVGFAVGARTNVSWDTIRTVVVLVVPVVQAWVSGRWGRGRTLQVCS